MNSQPKTESIIKYNKEKSDRLRENVLEAIKICQADRNITTKRVCEIAGISRSYFTNHPDMRKILDESKNIINRRLKKRRQSGDSKDTLIQSLHIEIEILKRKVKTLEYDQKYKSMYEEKCLENEKLKNQLLEAFIESGFLDF